MKNISLIPFVILVFLFAYPFMNVVEKRSIEPKEESDFDYFFAQRSFPYGKINYEAQRKASQSFRNSLLNAKMQATGVWQFAGPVNIGGRITDIEMDPTTINIAYLTGASGGVFKTIDGGANWFPIFDNESTQSIGDMAVAASNPDILYVGTGEANCGSGSLTYDANGIYKSIDAGNSWTNVGLINTHMTGKMAIHPTNPDIVFAATMGDMYGAGPDRGLFRTTNGGFSWQKVLFLNDSTGAIDVTINPQNPNIVYAAMWERIRRVDDKRYYGQSSGLYKSIDGGITWVQLTNGLPNGSLSRICVDLCNDQPNIVYVKVVDNSYNLEGIYKSIDDGATFSPCNISSIPATGGSGEYWFGKIKVDPTNPDIVYQIGFDIFKTTDGGNSWSPSFSNAHVDHHAIAIHPLDNSFVMNGSDGGLQVSSDGGTSWTHDETLPLTQFYTCELDNTIPDNLYGGSQDNNCLRTVTGGLNDWEYFIGGDGFYCLIDPVNNQNQFGEYQYGNLYKSTDGGFNFSPSTNGIYGTANWNCPVIFDPQNSQIMYYGAQQVFQSIDQGDNWNSISPDLTTAYPNGGNLLYGTITTLDVSPLNSNFIYAGTDDGKVWMTNNGGASWSNVTGTLPQRWVTHISCDPFDQNRAYLTLSGYRYHDNAKHVYMTSNQGSTWIDISGNLPDVPMNDVVPDGTIDSVLYAASDAGVYYTSDLGNNWQPLGTGIPAVVCNDLKFHNPTHTLLVGTYGRGMYKINLSQIAALQPENESQHISISMFQNPVNSNTILNVFLSKKSDTQISIYEMDGKVIASKIIKNMNSGLNKYLLSDLVSKKLSAGTYIVTIKSVGNQKSLKFVVL